MLGLVPAQNQTTLLQGRGGYRAALCGLPSSPSRGQQWGDGSTHRQPAPPAPAPAAPGPAQGPPGTHNLSGHPLGFQRKHIFTCQSAHVPFFFNFADKRRSWESQAPTVWDAAGVACWQRRKKEKGQGPLECRLPFPSLQRDRVHQRLRGGHTGLLLQPPTHSFHTYLHAEEQDPLLPSREPPASWGRARRVLSAVSEGPWDGDATGTGRALRAAQSLLGRRAAPDASRSALVPGAPA